MIWKRGDIWIYHKLGHCIVIPTNAGWKSSGENVMGAGLALQAAERYPDLPMRYGYSCRIRESYVYFKALRLFLVPTKPLIKDKPWMSWNQSAKEETIVGSLAWLSESAVLFTSTKIYVPLLGAGNGGMSKYKIKNLMDEYLISDKFVGVIFKE